MARRARPAPPTARHGWAAWLRRHGLDVEAGGGERLGDRRAPRPIMTSTPSPKRGANACWKMSALCARSLACAYRTPAWRRSASRWSRNRSTRPCSSAYSRMVLSGAPSVLPRTVSADCEMTPLWVFCPVTMAVMPAAESVTICDAVEVSDSAMFGIFWMNSAARRAVGVQAGRGDRRDAAGIGEEQHDVLGPALRGEQRGHEQNREEDLLHARQYMGARARHVRRLSSGARIRRYHLGPCVLPLALVLMTPALVAGRHHHPDHAARRRRPRGRPARGYPRRSHRRRRRRAGRPAGLGRRRQEWTSRNDPRAQEGAAAGTTNFLSRRFSSDHGRAAGHPGHDRRRRHRGVAPAGRGLGRAGAPAAAPRPQRHPASSATAWARRTARPRASSRAASHNGKAARPARDGHARGDRPGDDRVAERRRHRLVAGHGGLRDRPEERQQPGRRLPGQHRRLLRQPAHRVPRRDPPPHARHRASTSAS